MSGECITAFTHSKIADLGLWSGCDRVASDDNPVDKLSRGCLDGPCELVPILLMCVWMYAHVCLDGPCVFGCLLYLWLIFLYMGSCQFSVTPTWAKPLCSLTSDPRPCSRSSARCWFAVASLSGDGALLRPHRLHGLGAAPHGRALALFVQALL